MKNSEKYYSLIRRYLEAVGEIDNEYNAAMSRAKQYEGSTGGKALVDQATTQRDAALKAEKEAVVKAIREVIAAMKTNASTRKITAPTQEQLAILQALKMRQTVSKDEIKQAENSLKNCPLALSVLDEIAHDNGIIHTGKREAMTADYLTKRIDSLEHSALAMLRGDNARLGRVPADVGDCMTRWGAFNYAVETDEFGRQSAVVDTDTINVFCEAVDGRESTNERT